MVRKIPDVGWPIPRCDAERDPGLMQTSGQFVRGVGGEMSRYGYAMDTPQDHRDIMLDEEIGHPISLLATEDDDIEIPLRGPCHGALDLAGRRSPDQKWRLTHNGVSHRLISNIGLHARVMLPRVVVVLGIDEEFVDLTDLIRLSTRSATTPSR